MVKMISRAICAEIIAVFLTCAILGHAQSCDAPELIASGIWKYSFGTPDSITPVKMNPDCMAAGIPVCAGNESCPVAPSFSLTSRGTLISIPLKEGEAVYGLGEQLWSFNHRGTKKTLRVNADPKMDTGDSHAPVPFYVTTEGYGVLVDNARDITFYCGNKDRASQCAEENPEAEEGNDAWNLTMSNYQRKGMHKESEMLIEIPYSKGVDVYVFGGVGILDAVARYNMFAGGGIVPPRWGLGFWYRGNSNYTAEQFINLAERLRQEGVPCDVLGLETHWQTHAYSSSLVWDNNKFPSPRRFIAELAGRGIHLNMWLQAFTHRSAPAWEELREWSGDFTVWEGLVPDFITDEGRRLYAGQLEEYVDWGLSGFKADECDNSDFTGNWSFPYISQFPSGADGEQMHNLIGVKFQQTLNGLFKNRNKRTYSLVRSSGALAASKPFVLYSDLYDHRTFIKGIPQAGFSGLLWCPELRDAISPEELLCRLNTAVFSPLCMYNGWYLDGLPWEPHQGKDAEVKEKFKRLVELRMELVPYLHAAFVDYLQTGVPPFRALMLDYPEEKENLMFLDNQYMMGDAIMVAPQHNPREETASIYFPKGVWHDFFTGKAIDSDGEFFDVKVAPGNCPAYVKEGTLLPLAQVSLNTSDKASRRLHFRIFGNPASAQCKVYDDPVEADKPFKCQTFRYDGASKAVTGEEGFYSIGEKEI